MNIVRRGYPPSHNSPYDTASAPHNRIHVTMGLKSLRTSCGFSSSDEGLDSVDSRSSVNWEALRSVGGCTYNTEGSCKKY